MRRAPAGAISPSPLARVEPRDAPRGMRAVTISIMIKRLLIAGILVALFLGGVAYFNLVFKPAMIKDFVAKMAPPAVTVTAQPATSKPWVDKVQSIGTLIAIEGVDVAPEVGGIVKDYFFDSGQDVEKGAKLVELDTSVEEADLIRNQALLIEAENDLKRQQSLVKGKIVSQAVVDSILNG